MVKSSTTSGQLDIWKNAIEKADDSQTYPPVEASSGQEQYHQVSLTFTVRHKVSLTFTVTHTQVRCTPPVEASSDKEQYYIKSA